MSNELILNLTLADGSVKPLSVPLRDQTLMVNNANLVAVSENIAALTNLTDLRLGGNAFVAVPPAVWALTQLRQLDFQRNCLRAVPSDIGRFTALNYLFLFGNEIAELPREIGQLRLLMQLWLFKNKLTAVPAELWQLRCLRLLSLESNQLTWLPLTLDRLPATTKILLSDNPLPIDVGDGSKNMRPELRELFAATTALSMIREPSFDLLDGLQDLSLPALVSLEIIDAALPNSIAMHHKWNLITAVKHFHQRRA